MIRADCITYVFTLRNTIRAMKRELGLSYNSDLGEPDAKSYYCSLCIVGKMRLNTKGEHKKWYDQVEITFICYQNVGLY